MSDPLPFFDPGDVLGNLLPGGWRIIDVRKPAAVGDRMVKGAAWIDPFTLSFAHPLLKAHSGLVFYCVHGAEVSQFATGLSLVAGTPARYVRGGWAALLSAGAPTAPLSPWQGNAG